MSKDLDIVVYGATGFAGRQVAARLCAVAPAALRIGIAGRNDKRLQEVAAELDRDVECLIADSRDESSVHEMARRTRVLITTVGPYLLYGTPVFDACVAEKTAYVDITGEAHWVRGLITRHHKRARAEGTVLVPFCGYDSVPSDLGTFLMSEHLREKHGQRLVKAHASHKMKGGFGGGTFATLLSGSQGDHETRRAVFNPYALCPSDDVPRELRVRDRDIMKPMRSPHRGWDAPFFMAPVNTRVVRRTASLLREDERAYAEGVQYLETMGTSGNTPLQAGIVTAVLGTTMTLVKSAAGRAIIKRLAPAPGEGPSQDAIDNGFTKMRLFGEGDGGAKARLTLSYAGDPGSRFTVLSLTECALLLATEPEACGHGVPGKGGVLTPATAFGHRLAERLRANDVTLDIEDL